MKTMTRLELVAALLLGGCSLVINSGDYTGGEPRDGGVTDSGRLDGAPSDSAADSGPGDTGTPDAGACRTCPEGQVMFDTGHCITPQPCTVGCPLPDVCDPITGADCYRPDSCPMPLPAGTVCGDYGLVPECECPDGQSTPGPNTTTCVPCADTDHYLDTFGVCVPGTTLCSNDSDCTPPETCASRFPGDDMYCANDAPPCTNSSECGSGEFCDMMTGTCRPEPTCPASCAGACVRGRCLGAGGEACSTDLTGFLVRGGPVPRCGGLMAPDASISVSGRGTAQRVGPYPVSSGISDYQPNSLRVFADDTNADRVRFAWADLAAVQLGELRVSNDGRPPDVCVVADVDPFLNHICASDPFDASALAFDLQNVGSTNYAAFGGSANVDLYHEISTGCFTFDFTGTATDVVSNLAIIGGSTAVTMAYWSGGALSLVNSAGTAGTRALVPSSGIAYETPLVGAGSFLLFGMKTAAADPDPSPWANTIWSTQWSLSETAPWDVPLSPLAADSADSGSVFSGWEDVTSRQIQLRSASRCGAWRSCNGSSAAGASLGSTPSSLPLGIAAEPGGGALAVFGVSTASGDSLVMLDNITSDGIGTNSPVPLLRNRDVGGSIRDILGISVATNTMPDSGTVWEIDYGVVLKVVRDGIEQTELWGGALRFCGSRPVPAT